MITISTTKIEYISFQILKLKRVELVQSLHRKSLTITTDKSTKKPLANLEV